VIRIEDDVMVYEKKNIRTVIEDINSRKLYLPAIQRKYVWGDEQITRLMDSNKYLVRRPILRLPI